MSSLIHSALVTPMEYGTLGACHHIQMTATPQWPDVIISCLEWSGILHTMFLHRDANREIVEQRRGGTTSTTKSTSSCWTHTHTKTLPLLFPQLQS